MRRLILPGLLLAALAAVYVGTAQPIRSFADDDDKPASKSKTGPRVYKGRVIAPVMTAAGGGAEWLERPDRDETEQPDKVIEALKIAPGSVVADVGAGTGYFSIRIAKKIGPEGKVLATDVQPEMLRQLTENMKKAGVKNVDRILATANDSKLPTGKVDLVLMVDVYHELQDPERTMAQIRKSLKNDGRLVLVEYRGEDPDVPIKPEHKTTLRQIRYEIEPMGFRLKEVFEFLPHQHVEVFVKDNVDGEDEIIDPTDFPTIRKPGWAGVGSAEPYKTAGFQALFDGKSLAGWKGDDTVWRVRAENIVAVVPGVLLDGELATEAKFGDFEFDLQWRMKESAAGASVIVRRNPLLAVALDNGVPHLPGYPETIATRRTGQVISNAGRLIHRSTDTANALVMPAEWNRLTIRAAGPGVRVAVNGIETAAFEVGDGRPTGRIALGASRGEVEFREIWIKPLEQN